MLLINDKYNSGVVINFSKNTRGHRFFKKNGTAFGPTF